MRIFCRIALACALPLLLSSCLLVPGKFTSTLTVHADRSFTFSYQGEVIASDPGEGMAVSGQGSEPEDKAAAEAKAKEKAGKARDREAKNREIAVALAKEAGYRSVVYQGDGKFQVDYAVTGVLTTNFTYPFNSDAEVMVPFIAAEVRKDGTVRIKAPAFGKAGAQAPGAAQLPMMGEADNPAEGVFTLITDAEVVMHNQEDGVKASGTGKTITWIVGALKKDAPTAVLRMKN